MTKFNWFSDCGCFICSVQCSGTGSLWTVWQCGFWPVVQESASWRAASQPSQVLCWEWSISFATFSHFVSFPLVTYLLLYIPCCTILLCFIQHFSSKRRYIFSFLRLLSSLITTGWRINHMRISEILFSTSIFTNDWINNPKISLRSLTWNVRDVGLCALGSRHG